MPNVFVDYLTLYLTDGIRQHYTNCVNDIQTRVSEPVNLACQAKNAGL